VFAVALYHAVANVSTKSIFPGGSYPGERVISVILAVLAGVIALSWPDHGGERLARSASRLKGPGPAVKR
jgi:hypothetical protein